MRMAPMHHHIDLVEPAFEEVLIGLELERVRHDTRGIRKHAIFGDDGVTFDTTRTWQRNHFTTGRKSHQDAGGLSPASVAALTKGFLDARSEERRVGKECR